MADLYVCGLDLSTGRVVQPDEREVWEWHEKGHNGDGTLVCLECFHGAESPDGASRIVPLVPRGRIGGVRQRRFAHPPGMAPAGGHSPETAWHWEAKHRLCRWAREAAGASARTEAWTAPAPAQPLLLVPSMRGPDRRPAAVQPGPGPPRTWPRPAPGDCRRGSAAEPARAAPRATGPPTGGVPPTLRTHHECTTAAGGVGRGGQALYQSGRYPLCLPDLRTDACRALMSAYAWSATSFAASLIAISVERQSPYPECSVSSRCITQCDGSGCLPPQCPGRRSFPGDADGAGQVSGRR